MTKEEPVQPRDYDVDFVTSADGTVIGYRRYGHSGAGLVLLHGGMNAAQDLSELASVLSDRFTVYVPDRRGRGVSGPVGPGHTIQKQVDDVRAILSHTGARQVFGLSAGAVVSLEAAAQLAQISRLAVYEPPLALTPDESSWKWLARYDKEVADGNLGAALVTASAGTGDTSWLTWLPRMITVPFMNFAIKAQAQEVKAGEVPLRDLVFTMHDDAVMVKGMEGRHRTFDRIRAKVLLMAGSRSPDSLRVPTRTLSGIVADSTFVELADANHVAATNGEKPRAVARELQDFFTSVPDQL